MNRQKRSFVGVFLALTIILVGLLLLCSQRSAVKNDQDLATNDDAFRQELLDMLDLADDSTQVTSANSETGNESANDVLSLLTPESEKAQATTTPLRTQPTTTANNMGISDDMFKKVQSDVDRLEHVLESKSQSVDSLKRIVENKNARIRDLEVRTANRPAATTSRVVSSHPRNASVASERYASSGFMGGYQKARSLFESFNYQGAIATFEDLLAQYPNHPEADNCQYWIGECYYGLKQYQKAILEFQKVFAYSQADKHDDAQLMIGLSYVKLGERDRANAEFETFLNTYAGSEYTSIARRYYHNS
ncbi:MAG: tetratricopeptide repeat protein [Calditrichaeota bacterium]|nr:tetratricopeptide repeat protein [Calditrichota bacterium]